MKLCNILIAGASLIVFTTPVAAQTFNWSFANDFYGEPDQFVTGTISGLVEGTNDAHGLSITVTSTPNGQGLGSFSFYGSGSFVVTDGQVTYANASYGNDNLSLWFGTLPGNGTWYPEYQAFTQDGGDIYPQWDFGSTNPTLFTRAEEAAPAPEPASWAMMVGGFAVAGAAMRRRHKTALSFG